MDMSTSAATPTHPTAETPAAGRRGVSRGAPLRFDSLVVSAPHSLAKDRGTTTFLSIVLHGLAIAALIIVPLFVEEVLPAPGDTLRAFFVSPVDVAPPPPPPPPPAPSARAAARPQAAPPPIADAKFTAPVELPQEIVPEASIDLGLGIEGGVPGGVEGGVPGGVLGGVVGGLPQTVEAPPPPKAVRVGGSITAPKLVKRVQPEYPPLAAQARLTGLVILEALVDTRGAVKSAKVLRGAPLFDEPALAAVRQWRYQPLLLNGQPTDFIVVVTVNFNLKTAEATPQE